MEKYRPKIRHIARDVYEFDTDDPFFKENPEVDRLAQEQRKDRFRRSFHEHIRPVKDDPKYSDVEKVVFFLHHELGWSFNRIRRLSMPNCNKTIKRILERAYKKSDY